MFFQYQILEACMLGFHFSLFVERIPRLFPKCILILTGEMEVHGYKKKKKKYCIVQKVIALLYQRLTGPCWWEHSLVGERLSPTARRSAAGHQAPRKPDPSSARHWGGPHLLGFAISPKEADPDPGQRSREHSAQPEGEQILMN